MTEKEKFIQNIVKGMRNNKRSLVQRYGDEAEKIMFSVANKKWDEKMKKDKEQELKEMVITAYKKVISEQKEVVNSKKFIESLNENIRELTDEEYKIAKDFAAKKGGKLAAMGADEKTLHLSLTMPGKTDEVEFKLDKTGKELNESTDREVFERMEGLASIRDLNLLKDMMRIVATKWFEEGFEKEDIQLYMSNFINQI